MLAGPGDVSAREPYQPPRIVRHDAGHGARLVPHPGRRVLERIDGRPVRELVAAHGSPLFVFSERELRERARAMRDAFTSRWPRTRFAWSYKTNHLDAVCAVLHQEGWLAEVVSAAEYAMARRLGVPGSAIVFNGAWKPEAALRTAIGDGALVQVDGFEELDLLERIASERGRPFGVALRIGQLVPGLGAAWDRFGFGLERGEAHDAVRRLSASPHLRLTGLHAHLGTHVGAVAPYREAARRISALAVEVEEMLGTALSTIDLGGGFASSAVLAGTPEGSAPPSFEAYAEAITGELRAAFGDRDEPPVLILECGRALVDDAGTLLSTVVGTRSLPGGARGLVLDAGVNLLYTSPWFRHDVIPIQPVDGLLEEHVLYGPLCMAIDVVRGSVALPPLEAGHGVALRPVGAYNVTQWMQFSQMRPSVVLVTADGDVEVIRRAETIEDLKSIERLPERLRRDGERPGNGAGARSTC